MTIEVYSKKNTADQQICLCGVHPFLFEFILCLYVEVQGLSLILLREIKFSDKMTAIAIWIF